MKRTVFFVTILWLALTAVAQSKSAIQRRQLLNDQWLFVENDSDFTQAHPVTLPHDWSIHHGFDCNAATAAEGAYLPAGKGWYRRTLTLDKAYEGKKLRLYFEGVYMNARVYVNGHVAGGWPYGYSGFWVDATPYVTQGNNEIVVSVDNSQQKNCRWYSGSGIYRNVWLVTTPKTYIDDWSIQVATPDVHHVQLTANIIREDGTTAPLSRTIEVVDKQGRVIPTATNELTVTVSGAATLQGLGNADIKDEDPYYDAKHHVWHGRALAIVRNTGKPSKATLTVTSPNLPKARLSFK